MCNILSNLPELLNKYIRVDRGRKTDDPLGLVVEENRLECGPASVEEVLSTFLDVELLDLIRTWAERADKSLLITDDLSEIGLMTYV